MASGRKAARWNRDGPFTTDQVARLAGVSRQRLLYWIKQGLVLRAPDEQEEKSEKDWWELSFQDAVAATVIARLREGVVDEDGVVHRVSLKQLQRVRRYLTEVERLDHPFSEAQLAISGKEITLLKDGTPVGTLRAPGQKFLPTATISLGDLRTAIRRRAASLAAAQKRKQRDKTAESKREVRPA